MLLKSAIRFLLFRKAGEQLGLFDIPVPIKPYVRDGKVVPGHVAKRKKRIAPKGKQPDLFGAAEPRGEAIKLGRLGHFIEKHGGYGRVQAMLQGYTDDQRNTLLDSMAKLAGKTRAEVADILANGAKHETPKAPEGDLFEGVEAEAPRKESAKPKKPAISAKAKQAINVLQAGGYFRKQLHTQFRGGERFETYLYDKSGSRVPGVGIKTFFEVKDKLVRRDVPSSTVFAEEWVIAQDNQGPAPAPVKADDEPKEGDTKTEGGIDYRLQDGRWHRTTPEEKPAFTPTHELPDGTQVIAHADEAGVWVDAQGDEYESEEAYPIESAWSPKENVKTMGRDEFIDAAVAHLRAASKAKGEKPFLENHPDYSELAFRRKAGWAWDAANSTGAGKPDDAEAKADNDAHAQIADKAIESVNTLIMARKEQARGGEMHTLPYVNAVRKAIEFLERKGDTQNAQRIRDAIAQGEKEAGRSLLDDGPQEGERNTARAVIIALSSDLASERDHSERKSIRARLIDFLGNITKDEFNSLLDDIQESNSVAATGLSLAGANAKFRSSSDTVFIGGDGRSANQIEEDKGIIASAGIAKGDDLGNLRFERKIGIPFDLRNAKVAFVGDDGGVVISGERDFLIAPDGSELVNLRVFGSDLKEAAKYGGSKFFSRSTVKGRNHLYEQQHQEGERNAEGLVFHDGRWRREDEPAPSERAFYDVSALEGVPKVVRDDVLSEVNRAESSIRRDQEASTNEAVYYSRHSALQEIIKRILRAAGYSDGDARAIKDRLLLPSMDFEKFTASIDDDPEARTAAIDDQLDAEEAQRLNPPEATPEPTPEPTRPDPLERLRAQIEAMGGKAQVAENLRRAFKDRLTRPQAEAVINELADATGLDRDTVRAELGILEDEPDPAVALTIAQSAGRDSPFARTGDLIPTVYGQIQQETGKHASTFSQSSGFMRDPIAEAVREGQYQGMLDYAASLPVTLDSGISEELATRAFSGTSHSPERRGKAIRREIVQSLISLWHDFEPEYNAAPDDRKAAFVEAFQEIADGYRSRMRSYLEAYSRVMSTMIAGPSNFPVASNQKRSATADKRGDEASNYWLKAPKWLKAALSGPKDNTPKSELEDLQNRLDARQKAQATMKQVNAAIRKGDDAALRAMGYSDEKIAALKTPDFAGRVGYPDYSLTNNNREIHRLQERIKAVQTRMESAQVAAETGEADRIEFDGGYVERNHEANRLQVFFDGKPDSDLRQKMKANGFRWAPSQGAWQRQLTGNAEHSLQRALGDKINPAAR